MDNIPPPRTNVDARRGQTGSPRGHRSLRRRSASCCSTSATRTTAIGPIPSWAIPTFGGRSASRSTAGSMVRATFGNAAEVPYGPASSLLWIRHGAPARRRGANVARGAPAARRARLDGSRRRRRARRDGRPLALTLICPDHQRDPPADGAAGPGAAPPGRDPDRPRAHGLPALERAPDRRTLRHGFRRDEPGSVADGPVAGLVVQRRHQRGAATAIRRWTRCSTRPSAPRTTAPPRPGSRAAAHRGGRAGGVHVRAELHVRGAPAVRQRAHPAGIALARACASGR